MAVVWIDPGHGGKDPGAVSGERSEKVDNLRYALALAEGFRSRGHRAILTRTEDVTMELWQRTALEEGCQLAISCHRNAGPVTATGAELWLHSKAPQNYIAWATNMAQAIEKAGLPLRRSQIPQKAADGVFLGYRESKDKDYYVNAATKAPSVLIELGFITNEQDNQIFEERLPQLIQEVVEASCRFLDKQGEAPPPAPTIDYQGKYERLCTGLEQLLKECS